MKALIFREKGSLANLKLEEISEPSLKADEALVEVKAASINPSDYKSVLGKITLTTVPRVPGRDFAGIVRQGPKEWIGQEVFGMGGGLGLNRDGTHAQKVVVPVDMLVKKPSFLTFAQAAAMSLGYLTAWTGVVTLGQVQPGETVLITGVTGSVGSAAARIAKYKQAKVIGVARKKSDSERVGSGAVDSWIALEDTPLMEGVMALTKGKGAQLILDTVGGKLFEPCLLSLAQGGRQIAMATSVENPRVEFDLLHFYHRQAHLIGMDTVKLSYKDCAEVLKTILPGFKEGSFVAPSIETISLDKAIGAYRALADGKKQNKFVIEF